MFLILSAISPGGALNVSTSAAGAVHAKDDVTTREQVQSAIVVGSYVLLRKRFWGGRLPEFWESLCAGNVAAARTSQPGRLGARFGQLL